MTGVDKGSQKPAQFLVENIELLPKGRALDIAMGTGRNAIYLSLMGFEVEGIDVSRDAVNSAIERAKSSGVHIMAKVADLEDGYHIEKQAYDVIVCFNYLQRSLTPQIIGGLRKGGIVVYETYIVDQAQFGKPRNPDHMLKHNELLDIFRDLRCLRYREGIIENRKAIASIIAEKSF
jgi:2-polyprenyl-3-methyl-5-hydroxy-6-metoxy-1,4-benzoquinol methylase